MGCSRKLLAVNVIRVTFRRRPMLTSRLYGIFFTLLLALCLLPTASALITKNSQSRTSSKTSADSPSDSAALPVETVAQSSGKESGHSDCVSTDTSAGENGGGSAVDADIDLENCLFQGREYVTNYLKSLRKQHRHKSDRCSPYNDVVSCIRSHLTSLSSATSGEPCQRRHSRREMPSPAKTRQRHRRQRRPHRSSSGAGEGHVRSPSSSSSVDSPTGRRPSRQQLMEQLREWVPIVAQMDRVCAGDESSKSVMHNQQCIEEELQGLLSQHCDNLYSFNVEQHTRHECHFVRERLHCKEALVSSACGDEAGNFAFSLLKVSTERHLSKHGCKISRERNYTAFHYDSTCQRDIIQQVRQCSVTYLTEKNIAKFHEHNDLIALGNGRQLIHACRPFKQYSQCIEPVKSRCRRGVERIYDYESDLRRYVLKMERICNESVLNVYAGSMKCYQNVMTEGTLEQCDDYWKDVSPWIANITSYQFYCEPNHTNTDNLLIELQKLHMCHGAAVANECGQNASNVLSDLVHAALHDPHYLRLSYRADCELHRPQVTTTMTTTTTVSTTQKTHTRIAPEPDSVRGLRSTHFSVIPQAASSILSTDPSSDDESDESVASGSQSAPTSPWLSTTTNDIVLEENEKTVLTGSSSASSFSSSKQSASSAPRSSIVSPFLTVAACGICFIVTCFRKSTTFSSILQMYS